MTKTPDGTSNSDKSTTLKKALGDGHLQTEDPPEFVIENLRQRPVDAIRWQIGEFGMFPFCYFFTIPNDVPSIAIEDIASIVTHDGMDLYQWPLAMAMVVSEPGIARIDIDEFNYAFKSAIKIFSDRLPPIDAEMLKLSLTEARKLISARER